MDFPPITTILKTERLFLKFPQTQKEIDEIIKLTWSASRKPGFNNGMSWSPPETKESLYKNLEEGRDQWLNNECAHFFIYHKNTHLPIGRIDIGPNGKEHLGYWIHPDYGGKGFMKEAIQSAVAFGFTQLNMPLINAGVAVWNIASQKVMQSVGMQKVQTAEETFFVKNNQKIPTYRFEITKDQWSANQASL